MGGLKISKYSMPCNQTAQTPLLANKPPAPSKKKSLGYYNEVKSKSKEGAAAGGGMTQAGVDKYKRDNPGSTLKKAVTNCNAKVGTKPYKRQKAFCSRSKSWDGERGKAARRRWCCSRF